MVPIVYGPREHHAVRDAAGYRRAHQSFIARKARLGMRVAVHESPIVPTAKVDANSWIIVCECGAGNATDPEWGFACCYQCGAVHSTIVFPREAAMIEAVLLAQPMATRRRWDPEVDTLESLVMASEARGLPIPQSVRAWLKDPHAAVPDVPRHESDNVVPALPKGGRP